MKNRGRLIKYIYLFGLVFLFSFGCKKKQNTIQKVTCGNVVIYCSDDTVDVDSIFVAVIGLNSNCQSEGNFYIVSTSEDSSLINYDGVRRKAIYATIPTHKGNFVCNGFAWYNAGGKDIKEKFSFNYFAK